ncbi:hypothetical protein G6W61_10395 [Streptomyces sp. KAI-26]|uniref:hypothetical protein n=1 Tax=Streptomyces sp. KAI-26 TaxID=1169747 RepID=UPI00158707D9|nr:hypothetical protein [Streptomyces sp. KAI-26]NUV86615.1 hypothetical protein [Streptomyces sp. KAI-26]NUW21190.1 hypothetical protein [Streptomyces roseoviolaceus]
MKFGHLLAAGFFGAIIALGAQAAGTHSRADQPAPVARDTRTFDERMQDQGRQDWGDIDGHKDCWAHVGDTSYVLCRDGYRTSS